MVLFYDIGGWIQGLYHQAVSLALFIFETRSCYAASSGLDLSSSSVSWIAGIIGVHHFSGQSDAMKLFLKFYQCIFPVHSVSIYHEELMYTILLFSYVYPLRLLFWTTDVFWGFVSLTPGVLVRFLVNWDKNTWHPQLKEGGVYFGICFQWGQSMDSCLQGRSREVKLESCSWHDSQKTERGKEQPRRRMCPSRTCPWRLTSNQAPPPNSHSARSSPVFWWAQCPGIHSPFTSPTSDLRWCSGTFQIWTIALKLLGCHSGPCLFNWLVLVGLLKKKNPFLVNWGPEQWEWLYSTFALAA